jgi:ribosomal protein S8E
MTSRSKALTPCSSLGLLHQPNLRRLLSHNIFLIDQIQGTRKPWVAPVRSNTCRRLLFTRWPKLVKNKRNEKAAKYSVPLPKVRGIAEEEMFKVVKTGKKTAKKGISDLPCWKACQATQILFDCPQIPAHMWKHAMPSRTTWPDRLWSIIINRFLGWKRMITKPTFVGPDFTRRPVKYERFIRPMGLRYKKANVTVSQTLDLN